MKISKGLPGGFRLKPVLNGMTPLGNLVDAGQLPVVDASPGQTGASKKEPLIKRGLTIKRGVEEFKSNIF